MLKKWKSVARRLAANHVPAILFVLALGLFLWGGYVVSPWFNGELISVSFAHQRLAEVGLGVIYMSLGLTRMVGSIRKNLKMMLAAPYGLMMGYLFLALLDLQTMGWHPRTFLPLVVCAIIAGICRMVLLYGPSENQ